MLASERLGSLVVPGVQLPSPEAVRAGNLRDVGRLPGAGGVEDSPCREGSPVRFDLQAVALVKAQATRTG